MPEFPSTSLSTAFESARSNGGPWIDNHFHMDADSDLEVIVAAAEAAGVVAMVCVGTDVASSRHCLERSTQSGRIWATAGVHPHDAAGGTEGLREIFTEAVDGQLRLVAVGECGLDFHYDHSPRAEQRKVFTEQIRLAHEFALPLVIHTRSAWDETFEILDAEGVPERTVFHCFTGGPSEAAGALERGALLSISGIVTFKSADDVRSAVEVTPLENLMVETDSPFLTPVPHRGRPNEPAMVGLIGEAVAKVKGLDVATVAEATTANASAFYGLSLT
ncbi:MAG: TatD family hydrolase [Microthrixaceae bacterium]